MSEATESRIFDPIKKVFDFSKTGATDCVENTKIHLPHIGDPKEVEGVVVEMKSYNPIASRFGH